MPNPACHHCLVSCVSIIHKQESKCTCVMYEACQRIAIIYRDPHKGIGVAAVQLTNFLHSDIRGEWGWEDDPTTDHHRQFGSGRWRDIEAEGQHENCLPHSGIRCCAITHCPGEQISRSRFASLPSSLWTYFRTPSKPLLSIIMYLSMQSILAGRDLPFKCQETCSCTFWEKKPERDCGIHVQDAFK